MTRSRLNPRFCFLAVLFPCMTASVAVSGEVPDSCNVVWDTPSENSLGSMPLGNGDIGLNLWTDPEALQLAFLRQQGGCV